MRRFRKLNAFFVEADRSWHSPVNHAATEALSTECVKFAISLGFKLFLFEL